MISLRGGGTLAYDEAFLGNEEADALFDRLRAETPWKQEAGRGRPFPRCTPPAASGYIQGRRLGHQGGHRWSRTPR
jgi:hypothetical protein